MQDLRSEIVKQATEAATKMLEERFRAAMQREGLVLPDPATQEALYSFCKKHNINFLHLAPRGSGNGRYRITRGTRVLDEFEPPRVELHGGPK